MGIQLGDRVRIDSTTVPATQGTVRDIQHTKNGVCYLVEWGSPAYGVPAEIWTSGVRPIR
jgi:hypothetical protein